MQDDCFLFSRYTLLDNNILHITVDNDGKCQNIQISSMKEKMNKNKCGKYYYVLKEDFAIESNLIYINQGESKFDLNKWIKPDKDGKSSFYNVIDCMPFSFGRRDCAGRSFALKEIYLVLANLIINYKFFAVDPSQKITFVDTIVKTLKSEIPVYVKNRNKQ